MIVEVARSHLHDLNYILDLAIELYGYSVRSQWSKSLDDCLLKINLTFLLLS